MTNDLRHYLQILKDRFPKEYVTVSDSLDGNWSLAAVTSEFEARMRVPVICYDQVQGSELSVIHNVCASLSRIAKTKDWTVPQLETRLAEAYEHLVAPKIEESGPVRDCVFINDEVDLNFLPDIRYTETETSGYISAAILVARDPDSGSLNLSFHRLMKVSGNSLAIYMTPGGHLDRIHEKNSAQGKPTPVAAFIGSHPLWALGALAAGPLDLDEYEVIGGLLEEALPVVRSQLHPDLLIPAFAEIVLEGEISAVETASEGPYGEAFGFVSNAAERPVFTVSLLSHRKNPLFQDIVPAKMEHMTMTSTAIRIHLQRSLLEDYSFIEHVHMPAPMTVYLKLKANTMNTSSEEKRAALSDLLQSQRFLKNAIVFDHDIDISNPKQTARAISMHVQADRDLVIVTEQLGNGLDPSERGGKTTKWGLDATLTADPGQSVTKNQIPAQVLADIDIKSIMDRAMNR